MQPGEAGSMQFVLCTHFQKFGSWRQRRLQGSWWGGGAEGKKTTHESIQAWPLKGLSVLSQVKIKLLFSSYLAGVELDESLLPKIELYCGGPLGGAANKHFTQEKNPITTRLQTCN